MRKGHKGAANQANIMDSSNDLTRHYHQYMRDKCHSPALTHTNVNSSKLVNEENILHKKKTENNFSSKLNKVFESRKGEFESRRGEFKTKRGEFETASKINLSFKSP